VNYETLTKLPKLNGVTLISSRTFSDLGLVPISTDEVTELMLEVFGYVL
jgi:hypothetical protein